MRSKSYMASVLSVWYGMAVTLMLGACGPQGGIEPVVESKLAARYAAAICEEIEECGCTSNTWGDLTECSRFFEKILSEQQDIARSLGLQYDGDCAQGILVAAAKTPCNEAEAPTCQIYAGNGPQGSECSPIGYSSRIGPCSPLTVCSAGLGLCLDPGTTPPTRLLGGGDQCLDEDNQLVGYCNPVESSYCSLDMAPPVCSPRALVGEECSPLPRGGRLCEFGAYCRGDGICVAQRADGEECAGYSECRSTICVDAKCQQAFTSQCPLTTL